jgi:hypothetical protein
MSRAVQISRIARRRQYAGFIYTRTLGRTGAVTLAGREWAEATAGLRLTLIEDGSILAHAGADLRLEIYERKEAA